MYSTVPWIINNMILEPTEITKSRQPSEIELKVQKSLQQLTVPDWYANKSIASPKIIVDRRPFEIRPAPWKDPVRNCAPLKNPWKNFMANTDVVKPVVAKTKTPADPELEKLDEVTKVSSAISPTSYSSKTFPKISPSRKIQNINIVFPTTTPSTETMVESTDDKVSPEINFLDKSTMSIDSLENFIPQRMSSLENKLTSVTGSTPIKTSTVRALTFQDTPKILKMNCSPPSPPKTTPPNTSRKESFDFGDQSFSTPKEFPDTEKILLSPLTKSNDTGFFTPQKTGKNFKMNCPTPPVPVTPAKTSDKDRSNFSENSSMTENVFSTPKKSTEMENIIKNQQKRSSGKSFVEEIIQELNAKCSPRVKSNYVSPASKNFVKKLVRALEMGCAPKCEEDDQIFESCSDTECKSDPSSTTISMKDSDSGSGSDCEIKSSAGSQLSRDTTFRSFSMALEDRGGKISRESIIPYVDDEDESVYWIPLPTCKLPRTSSLKNMMSRLSSNGVGTGTTSPVSSSPDPADALRGSPLSWQSTNLQNPSISSGWGKTFDKRHLRSRQLFRIDETTVIDSGYSDRSETNSSSSSVIDESWLYGDSETTQTASEISQDYENIHSNLRSHHRRIHCHRQSTFAV